MMSIIQKNYLIFLSVLLLGLSLYFSSDFGPSNDEYYQVPYGRQSFNYYYTFGQNDSIVEYKIAPLMRNYGAFIDMIPAGISHIFSSDLMNTRHFFITLVSFFYIFFGMLIAQRIAGNTAGFLALLFLVFTPRIFGEMFNNPKDPPYLATYICSLYCFMYFFDHIRNISRRSTLLLFLGFAVSMLVRASGILVFFYFVLFLALELYTLKKDRQDFDFKKIVKSSVITGALGYFSSILFWPSMLLSPFTKPFEAIKMLQQFPVFINNLYEGKYVSSGSIPWYYSLKYYLISNPETILLGILVFGIMFLGIVKTYNRNRILLLLFSSVFPIAMTIIQKSGLYTGWRHTYFAYIPLVILSAISYAYILDHKLKVSKTAKLIITGLIALTLLPTFIFYVKHHPYFYVYFNPTFGGAKKALGNYDLDYYSHSLKPATDWLYENEPNLKNLKIASNNLYQVQEVLKQKGLNKSVEYIRYRERYDSDWDYALMTQSFVDADYLKNGYFPPKGTVKTIDVDGVPICAIIKRSDKNDFYGKKALDSGQYSKAIEFLQKAIQYDDKNEIAWTNLGMAQLQLGQAAASIPSFKRALEISPESFSAMNGLVYAYLNTQDVNYARYTLEHMIESNPNYAPAYEMLGKIYQNEGNSQKAQEYFYIYQQLSRQ